MNTEAFKRYFTFWFSTLANGGEPRSVLIHDKDFYIQTKRVALEHGPIIEDGSLGRVVVKIFADKFSI